MNIKNTIVNIIEVVFICAIFGHSVGELCDILPLDTILSTILGLVMVLPMSLFIGSHLARTALYKEHCDECNEFDTKPDPYWLFELCTFKKPWWKL